MEFYGFLHNAAYHSKLVVEYSTPEDTTPEPNWVSKSYAYTETNHVHAVSSVVVTDDQNTQTTNTYLYDGNGNMTCRKEGLNTYLQSYNWENRLSGVEQVSGNCDAHGDTLKAWSFTYDGDGSRVKQVYTVGNTVTTTYYFMGGSYEVQVVGSTETVRQYYSIAGMSVAMREGETVSYFLTDHLGSVVGVTNSSGSLISEVRYLPFGEVRTDVGTQYGITQTDFGYTFQHNLPDMGLMDYKARFYSPYLGRFIQPDSIVPGAGNPQTFNRYSYSNNNPLNYTDPTGHMSTGACGAYGDDCQNGDVVTNPPQGEGSNNGNPEGTSDNLPGLPLSGSNHDTYDPFQFSCSLVSGSFYEVTCLNLNQAISIAGNPLASEGDQLLAKAYITLEIGAHFALVIGLTILAWEGIISLATSCALNPQCEQKVWDAVSVTSSKINYVMNEKAGFSQMGYTAETLETQIYNIGSSVTTEMVSVVTKFGTKFMSTDVVVGPNGFMGRITSVWQVNVDSTVLRFITGWAEVFK